jgi:hypothetical protein
MKSDVVLTVGIVCLAILGFVSANAFSEGVAKVLVGSAIGVIAAICGVKGGITIRDIMRGKLALSARSTIIASAITGVLAAIGVVSLGIYFLILR